MARSISASLMALRIAAGAAMYDALAVRAAKAKVFWIIEGANLYRDIYG